MATSGTTSYSQTRIDLVKGALRLAGVLDGGKEADADSAATANDVLNLYIKGFQSKAPQLWRETQAVLFLVPGTQSYQLGAGGDRACRATDFVETTLSADEAAAQTVLSVTSVSGIAVSDQIGIELADGTRQWTTVSAVGASTVTVAVALTGAASSGATVYCYTTLLERPLRITDMQRRVQGYDTDVELASRQAYFQQPTKTQRGQILQAYYAPQLTRGTLYVWPTAATVKETLRFTMERSLEDMTANANDFDLPQEWLETFKFGLAYRLGLEFSTPAAKLQMLKGEAEQREAELLAFDQEIGSIFFAPDNRRFRR